MKPRHIELLGQERPVYFGFNALHKVEKATGVTFARIAELFEDISVETLVLMLHVALEEGARKEGTTNDLTQEDLYDALDEYGFDRLDEVIESLTSFFVPTAAEGSTDEPGE